MSPNHNGERLTTTIHPVKTCWVNLKRPRHFIALSDQIMDDYSSTWTVEATALALEDVPHELLEVAVRRIKEHCEVLDPLLVEACRVATSDRRRLKLVTLFHESLHFKETTLEAVLPLIQDDANRRLVMDLMDTRTALRHLDPVGTLYTMNGRAPFAGASVDQPIIIRSMPDLESLFAEAREALVLARRFQPYQLPLRRSLPEITHWSIPKAWPEEPEVDNGSCSICKCRQVSILFNSRTRSCMFLFQACVCTVPCGHIYLCVTCVQHYKQRPMEGLPCGVCREPVQQFIRTYS